MTNDLLIDQQLGKAGAGLINWSNYQIFDDTVNFQTNITHCCANGKMKIKLIKIDLKQTVNRYSYSAIVLALSIFFYPSIRENWIKLNLEVLDKRHMDDYYMNCRNTRAGLPQ